MMETPRKQTLWVDAVVLALIALAFLAIRLPVMYRTYSGEDEAAYGVPGITVYRTGLPQIPYMANRNPNSVFWYADKVLLAEPPLHFYVEGAMVAILGETLAATRTASAVMGIVVLILVYRLTLFWFGSRRAALFAVWALSLSRGFLFPAITARPDMTAVVCLLSALMIMSRSWGPTGISNRQAALAGGFLGLGFLTHPFAIVGLCQQSLWLLWTNRRKMAWFKPMLCLLAGCALAVSPILILVLKFPEEFRLQFGNNIFDPGSGHLSDTLIKPWATIDYQFNNFINRVTPWQGAFLIVAGLAAMFSKRGPGSGHFRYCMISSPFFVGLALGHHPGRGYYVYVVVVLCAGLGFIIDAVLNRISSRQHAVEEEVSAGASRDRIWRPAATPVAVIAVLAAFVPGGGFRTTLAHLRNWNSENYRVEPFVDRVLQDIPEDAPFTVHEEMILHVWLRRPHATTASINYRYYDVRDDGDDYQYALLRPDDEKKVAEKIGDLEPVRTYGDLDDVFSMKSQLYIRRDTAETPFAENRQ